MVQVFALWKMYQVQRKNFSQLLGNRETML